MVKKSEKSDDSSSAHQLSPRSGNSGGNAVKKIASKFLQESSSHESDISDKPKPDNLKRTMSTNSGYKSRPVLEKFAPKETFKKLFDEKVHFKAIIFQLPSKRTVFFKPIQIQK